MKPRHLQHTVICLGQILHSLQNILGLFLERFLTSKGPEKL